MKALAVIWLLLASCASTSLADVVMPDEFTLGHADTTSALVGGYRDHQPMHEYDGESSTMAMALTWHLPPINEPMSRDERHRIREENLLRKEYITEELINEELVVDTTMASGGAYKADWRHAAGFGGVIALLLIGLLVKLQRSNGWH